MDHSHGEDDGIEPMKQLSPHYCSFQFTRCRDFDDILEDIRQESTPKSSATSSSVAKHISHNDMERLLCQDIDPERFRGTQQRFLTGWRFGALLSLVGALSVTLFNIIITVWVWKHPNHDIEGSIGTLYKGSCKKAKSLDVWVHLLINILSTLLLSVLGSQSSVIGHGTINGEAGGSKGYICEASAVV